MINLIVILTSALMLALLLLWWRWPAFPFGLKRRNTPCFGRNAALTSKTPRQNRQRTDPSIAGTCRSP